MKTLTIVGGGPGGIQHLTQEALDAIASAEHIYAQSRMRSEYKELNANIKTMPIDMLPTWLNVWQEDTAIIVSGDTGFFSFARTVSGKLQGNWRVRFLPGISCLQMLCARLGIGYETLPVRSIHGRNTSILGAISYNTNLFVLAGAAIETKALMRQLCEADLGDVKITVGSNLFCSNEAIYSGTAQSLLETEFADLTVLLLQNDRAQPGHTRFRDTDFTRGDVPMTKEAVRTLAVSQLEVKPNSIVYDIGAGTGSVSIALAQKAADGLVYAVERKSEGIRLIKENRRKLCAHNVLPIHGEAPNVFDGLPPPDRVFIGGSDGKLEQTVDALLTKATAFRLCLTSITIETLGQAVALLQKHCFTDIEVQNVQISHARCVGKYHMMQAQNPVYLISGGWEK